MKDDRKTKEQLMEELEECRRAEKELRKHHDQLEKLVKDRTADLTNAINRLKLENDVRKTTEAILRSREVALETKQQELEEINAALKVLLTQREKDKSNIEMNIISNLKMSVFPCIEKLEAACRREDLLALLSLIRAHLKEIISPFIRKISSDYLGFTPSEIQVASLIKEGKSSKEIAKLLNVSQNTVITHRFHIRKKAGLKNKKVNLRSYLQTLE
jgi:DNA-binding CsgD family transcriptional regulator